MFWYFLLTFIGGAVVGALLRNKAVAAAKYGEAEAHKLRQDAWNEANRLRADLKKLREAIAAKAAEVKKAL